MLLQRDICHVFRFGNFSRHMMPLVFNSIFNLMRINKSLEQIAHYCLVTRKPYVETEFFCT